MEPEVKSLHSMMLDWQSACRRVFEERYETYPTGDEKNPCRVPLSKIWPGIWDTVPLKSHVIVIQAPEVKQFGLIHIPEGHSKPAAWGWVMSISPALTQEDGFKSVETPLVIDPMEFVGRPVSWGEYAGVPLRRSVYDRSFEGIHLQMRLDDLLGFVINVTPTASET